jgi:hypothetical protein
MTGLDEGSHEFALDGPAIAAVTDMNRFPAERLEEMLQPVLAGHPRAEGFRAALDKAGEVLEEATPGVVSMPFLGPASLVPPGLILCVVASADFVVGAGIPPPSDEAITQWLTEARKVVPSAPDDKAAVSYLLLCATECEMNETVAVNAATALYARAWLSGTAAIAKRFLDQDITPALVALVAGTSVQLSVLPMARYLPEDVA